MGTAGRLFYLMGGSGAGKDSLLRYLRVHLTDHDSIVVAHRYITRPPGPDENHIALTPAEFDLRERAGGFAFWWSSHGYRYGIGIEVDAWTAAGLDVVVNGSRAAYERIHGQRRALHGILVTASDASLRARLARRGRESEGEIEARLARHRSLPVPPGVIRVANDGPLEDAGTTLLALLRAPRADAAPDR